MMNNKQIQKIFADKVFVKELMALEDNAAFQAALKEKGVEVTEEEVALIRQLQAKAAAGEITKEQLENGELPEELLEEVSGGIVATGIIAAFLGALGYAITDELTGKKSNCTVTNREDGSVNVSGGW